MATITASPTRNLAAAPITAHTARRNRLVVPAPIALAMLTLLAALVLGYHPYSEDAGIYLAGIKYLLHPENFPVNAAFITHHMQLSIFAPLMAAFLRLTHLPMVAGSFAVHLLLLFAFLRGSLALARRLFPVVEMQWAAVTTLALTLSTPVAGTALYLADPYLTGRSFIAPLFVFAVCFVLRRRWTAAALSVLAAAFIHPLMAGYLALLLAALAIAQSCHVRWLAAMPIAALAAGAVITLSQRGLAESPAYLQAVLSRTYFYLGEWQWYEDLGIVLPLLLLTALVIFMRRRWSHAANAAALACIAAGVSVSLVSLAFVRPAAPTHLLARMQVLREFSFIYVFMFLMVGAVIGRWLLRASLWRWAAYTLALSAGLLCVQRSIYPASPHLQLSASGSANPWQQAFLWISANTPRDALFAINPYYISLPGEDTIGFRAAAERSVLADASKDGGAAAIFPDLADTWQQQVAAVSGSDSRGLGSTDLDSIGLDSMPDAARRARLAPFGVTWLVLARSAQTSLDCPYRNAAVQVCRF